MARHDHSLKRSNKVIERTPVQDPEECVFVKGDFKLALTGCGSLKTSDNSSILLPAVCEE